MASVIGYIPEFY